MIDDLILFGSSSKRGDSTKIGQFGSGNKYGLPVLVRNGSIPIIYSGERKMEITFQERDHRGFIRQVIFIDGHDSSITTDTGPKWHVWMALREIYSNAIDEGEEKFYTTETLEEAIANARPDRTLYIIPITEKVREVVDNFEHYFAFDREPDFISTRGFAYLSNEKSNFVVYRKGIRCIDDYFSRELSSYIHFNLNEVDISEDRIADQFDIRDAIKTFMRTCDDKVIWKNFILSGFSTNYFPGTTTGQKWFETCMDTLKDMVKDGYKFTTSTYKSLLGVLSGNIEIPSYYYQELIKQEILVDPLGIVTSTIDIPHVIMAGDYSAVEDALEKIFPMIDVTVSLAKYEAYAGAYTRRVTKYDKNEKIKMDVLVKYHENRNNQASNSEVLKDCIQVISQNLPADIFEMYLK